MDGSNRVTLRNRKFIRKISPVCVDQNLPDFSRTPSIHHEINNSKVQTKEDFPAAEEPSLEQAKDIIRTNNEVVQFPAASKSTPADSYVSNPTPEIVRRGTRNRPLRQVFQAQLQGKTHHERSIDTDQ